jgi:BlaI family transcriptional regulator, penicillinase repressor
MAPISKDVSDRELEVLRLLWELGPATIRQLTDRLHPGGGTSKYGSVQVFLDRLEEKGYVARERRAGAHLFRPLVGRDELIGRKLRSVAEQLCDGSVTPLLTHLMRAGSLSERERQELRSLIDNLDRKPGDPGRNSRRSS